MMTEPTAGPLSLAQAARYWLRLGFINFGGPAGQIAIMHRDLVEQRQWISERRFLHALNYCMVLPGPGAAASNLHRLANAWHAWCGDCWRSVCAALLVRADGVFLALYGAGCGYHDAYAVWHQAAVVAVVAVVAFAAWRMGKKVLQQAEL
jgi:chromate transporter